jgi:hypothetical protein
MSKTIKANIPARKSGKIIYPARVETFTQDDAGRWMMGNQPMTEADVIDVCQHASNWQAIRAEHFPMFGFSS